MRTWIALPGPGPDRTGGHPGARPGRVPGDRSPGRLRQGGAVERRPVLHTSSKSCRAHEPGPQERDPQSGGVASRCSPMRCRTCTPDEDAHHRWTPQGRVAAQRHHSSPPDAVEQRGRPDSRAAKRPVDHRGARGPLTTWRPGRPLMAERTPERAGDHHLQGQGLDLRPSSSGVRSARPQRHPHRELLHERGRPAPRSGGELLQPHRHHAQDPHHPGGLRPHGPGSSSTPIEVPVWGDIGTYGRAMLPGSRGQGAVRPSIQRMEIAGAVADLASTRRNASPETETSGPGEFDSACHLRRPHPAPSPNDAVIDGRRGQQHLLVRAVLRVQRAGRAHVGIPGLDRLRVSGGPGGMGGHPGEGSPFHGRPVVSVCRVTAGSASTWARSPPRSSTA